MVDFKQAIVLGVRNYINFTGRSTRAEFWWWMLLYGAGYFLLQLLGEMVDATTGSTGEKLSVPSIVVGFLGLGYGLFFLVPNLSIAVRRVRDTGKSLWWLSLLVVPYFVLLLAFVGGLLVLGSGSLADLQFGNGDGWSRLGALLLVIALIALVVLLITLTCYIILIVILAKPSAESRRNATALPTAPNFIDGGLRGPSNELEER